MSFGPRETRFSKWRLFQPVNLFSYFLRSLLRCYREYNDVAFLRILVSHRDASSAILDELKTSLPLVAKWYDDTVLDSLYEVTHNDKFTGHVDLQPVDFEVLTGLLNCVHLVKAGTEMYEFSKPNIYSVTHRPQAYRIVDLFKKRFDPYTKHPEQDDSYFQK